MPESPKTDSQSAFKEVINNIAGLIKTSQIHDPSNVAVSKSLSRFQAAVNEIAGSNGNLNLRLVGDFMFVNDERLRYSQDSNLNCDFMIQEMKKRDVGEITFLSPLPDRQIQLFVSTFIEAGVSLTPFKTLSSHLAGSQISVSLFKELDLDEETLDRRKMARRSYFNAVSYAKGVMAKVKTGERINLRKAKRVVESLVDQVANEKHLLIGMTSIKDYDEYTYCHSVNVSILAIALGQRINLSRYTLEQLGIASFFHDIGKVEVPTEILNKPTSFNDQEWSIMRQHPLVGLKAILRLKDLDETTMKSAIVAFKHHQDYDGSGYPQTKTNLDNDLLSEIITIADRYDAMTASRVYARVPSSPDRALSILLELAGTHVNPALIKVFVNMVGVYPQGSLVLLDTKELGLVFETNSDPALLDRPRVVIVIDQNGKSISLTNSFTIDLTRKDASGRFLRSIVRTLDPNMYGINLSEFLL